MASSALSPLQRFLLDRLERFSRIAASRGVYDIPQCRRLARHATLGAYRDCVEAGLTSEADGILHDALRSNA